MMSFEERSPGSWRMRARIRGRMFTLAADICSGNAVAARDERVPTGRVVYFIQRGNYVKVGFTDDVARRLQQLASSSPETVVLLTTVPGGRCLEAALHDAFRELRVSGEWFHHRGPLARLTRLLCSREAA